MSLLEPLEVPGLTDVDGCTVVDDLGRSLGSPYCVPFSWSGWNGNHCTTAVSFVKRLLARCGTDVTSAPDSEEFRRGYCQYFDLEK